MLSNSLNDERNPDRMKRSEADWVTGPLGQWTVRSVVIDEKRYLILV